MQVVVVVTIKVPILPLLLDLERLILVVGVEEVLIVQQDMVLVD